MDNPLNGFIAYLNLSHLAPFFSWSNQNVSVSVFFHFTVNGTTLSLVKRKVYCVKNSFDLFILWVGVYYMLKKHNPWNFEWLTLHYMLIIFFILLTTMERQVKTRYRQTSLVKRPPIVYGYIVDRVLCVF